MLQLRPEQYEALLEHTRKQMEGRLFEAVLKRWPELCKVLGHPTAREQVHHARRTANKLGIEREQDLNRFVALWFTWGESFHAKQDLPWAGEILRWPETDPATKLDALEGRSSLELKRRPDITRKLK
jgi:hypothetical protein